uniref:Uncharacterized protein n=1 Tax=Rhizophora mucronata TaxID=61149 RepID=A0A2P2N6I8_RHIMU
MNFHFFSYLWIPHTCPKPSKCALLGFAGYYSTYKYSMLNYNTVSCLKE